MPGRPRKPTALHQLHGTSRPDRMNPHEPQLPVLVGATPPSWVKGKARAFWKQIAVILTEMRVLTVSDVPALALVCDALAEYIAARAAVQQHGMTYDSKTVKVVHTSDGDEVEIETLMVRARPEVAIASDAWRRAMMGLVQLGMTPSARTKVAAIGDEAEEDPFEQLLKRKEGKG